MLAEMPRMLRCRHIEQADLLAGNWRDAIEALLAQEEPPERPRVDGASVAASAILGMARRTLESPAARPESLRPDPEP